MLKVFYSLGIALLVASVARGAEPPRLNQPPKINQTGYVVRPVAQASYIGETYYITPAGYSTPFATSGVTSGCVGGNCPTASYTSGRTGLFGRRR